MHSRADSRAGKILILGVIVLLILALAIGTMGAGNAINASAKEYHGGKGGKGGKGGGGAAPVELTQETEQEIDETGDVTLNTTVTSSGNNSNQCAAPLQFGNTGNLQNAQDFLESNSTADDIEFEGSGFTFAPELTNACEQTVQQAAAAGGGDPQ